MSEKTQKSATNRVAFVNIGGVQLQAGFYLASNSKELVKKKPDKKQGYAHFDGETLTLKNYHYSGAGTKVSSVSVGMDLSNTSIEVVIRGENVIEIAGGEKNAALLINDGKVTIGGRGTLCLYARGGKLCNFGMLGTGTVKLTGGTIRLQAGIGNYTIGDEGQRIYTADSYAVKVGKLIARLARIRGDDRDDEEKDERTDINELNKNNETEVVIDFPKRLIWWRKGCLLQLILAILAIIAIIIIVWYVSHPEIIEPDYNILEVDENIEEMPDEGDPVESVGGGGSVVLNFSYDVTVDLSAQKATLYFGLPSQSNKDAVLQLVVDDILVAQSGRLPPGHQVQTMTVRDNAARRLRPGGYNGELRVLYYDDDTGERAILDTKIEVSITVVN